jgi:cysteine-rich CPXCG protein
MKDEASYVCDSCGEEVVLPIDLSAGSAQQYVEDCPVCCCPNVIHVEVDEDGEWMWEEKSRIQLLSEKQKMAWDCLTRDILDQPEATAARSAR